MIIVYNRQGLTGLSPNPDYVPGEGSKRESCDLLDTFPAGTKVMFESTSMVGDYLSGGVITTIDMPKDELVALCQKHYQAGIYYRKNKKIYPKKTPFPQYKLSL